MREPVFCRAADRSGPALNPPRATASQRPTRPAAAQSAPPGESLTGGDPGLYVPGVARRRQHALERPKLLEPFLPKPTEDQARQTREGRPGPSGRAARPREPSRGPSRSERAEWGSGCGPKPQRGEHYAKAASLHSEATCPACEVRKSVSELPEPSDGHRAPEPADDRPAMSTPT